VRLRAGHLGPDAAEIWVSPGMGIPPLLWASNLMFDQSLHKKILPNT